jgi:tetratricopeptide (TPR) repeat protein
MALAASAAPLAPVSASDEAAATLECAEKLAPADARRRRAEERAGATLAGLCETGAAALTPDDRADACGNLVDARRSLGDAAGARRAAEKRLAVLEAAVRGLPDDVALIYDPALSDTLVSLGRGEEALALLAARARALPANYNPPYHLARIAAKLGRTELGLAAVDRALALAYGPRRANAYVIKAELLLGAGRRTEAVAVLEAELAFLTALPEGQKRPEAERRTRERLAALQAARDEQP